MKKTILFAISMYQFLSPFRGHCRYYPTCSQYAKESIKRYGVTKGGLLSLMKLLSCHPFAKVRSPFGPSSGRGQKLEVRSY